MLQLMQMRGPVMENSWKIDGEIDGGTWIENGWTMDGTWVECGMENGWNTDGKFLEHEWKRAEQTLKI